MSNGCWLLMPCLVVTAIALPAGPARADAIDGNWCYRDGRHIYIDGPRIVTPSGTKMTGDYRRHTFSYVVPNNDPGAGKVVFMSQQSEEVMHLSPDSRPGKTPEKPMQTWHRCKFSS